MVGPIYTPGTGTRRKGTARHLRVPPWQLPGPRLPTPCERAAAAQDRYATPDELAAEQQGWRQLEQDAADRAAQARDALLRAVPAEAPPPGVLLPGAMPWSRAWTLTDSAERPSPLWTGLTAPALWRAAEQWGSMWEIWARPWWSRTLWDALAALRHEATLHLSWDETTIRCGVSKDSYTVARVAFIRHLVTMRRVLTAIGAFGALWWFGRPSPAVKSVLASIDGSLSARQIVLHGSVVTLVSRWDGADGCFRDWWMRPRLMAGTLQLSPVHQVH